MPVLTVLLPLPAVVAGFGLMVFADRAKRRIMPGQSDKAREILRQPWLELGLGVIFTLSGLFFATRIFGGEWGQRLAFLIAGLITILTSWGAFTRFRPLLEPPGVDAPLRAALLRLHRFFCLGLWLTLAGMLGFVFLFLACSQN